MGKTADELTAEERDRYRAQARMHHAMAKKKLGIRRKKAWEFAHQAAFLLRKRYDVSRVVVFGSLLDESRFTDVSDVDIAAWRIPADRTFRAMGDVWDLGVVAGIPANLVDIDACRQDLREVILREGVDI
jgi:predicted nucleotidyltransferase